MLSWADRRRGHGGAVGPIARLGDAPVKAGEGALKLRHGSPRRSARRMEADVPRSVAHRAQLLLRPNLHGVNVADAEKEYEKYLIRSARAPI